MRKIFPLIGLLLLAGCGTKKFATTKKDIPARSEEEVIALIQNQESQESYFNFTALGRYEDSTMNQRFRIDVRIIRDSLIWVDVSDPMFGLKVARLGVWQDSVLLLNRLQQEYIAGSMTALQNKLNAPVNFQFLQGALMARAMVPVSKTDKPKIEANENFHVNAQPKEFPGVFVHYALDPLLQYLIDQSVSVNGVTLEARYTNYEDQSGIQKPLNATYILLPSGERKIYLSGIKYRLDLPSKYPLSIPASYERIRP